MGKEEKGRGKTYPCSYPTANSLLPIASSASDDELIEIAKINKNKNSKTTVKQYHRLTQQPRSYLGLWIEFMVSKDRTQVPPNPCPQLTSCIMPQVSSVEDSGLALKAHFTPHL